MILLMISLSFSISITILYTKSAQPSSKIYLLFIMERDSSDSHIRGLEEVAIFSIDDFTFVKLLSWEVRAGTQEKYLQLSAP